MTSVVRPLPRRRVSRVFLVAALPLAFGLACSAPTGPTAPVRAPAPSAVGTTSALPGGPRFLPPADDCSAAAASAGACWTPAKPTPD